MFWFSCRSTCTTRSTDRLRAVIFSFDSSMWIWRRSPPFTVTAATPGARSRRGASSFCAISRSVTGSKSPSTARLIIDWAFASALKICGGSASSGIRPRTRSTRLRTSSSASDMSAPQAKFNRTWLRPS